MYFIALFLMVEDYMSRKVIARLLISYNLAWWELISIYEPFSWVSLDHFILWPWLNVVWHFCSASLQFSVWAYDSIRDALAITDDQNGARHAQTNELRNLQNGPKLQRRIFFALRIIFISLMESRFSSGPRPLVKCDHIIRAMILSFFPSNPLLMNEAQESGEWTDC